MTMLVLHAGVSVGYVLLVVTSGYFTWRGRTRASRRRIGLKLCRLYLSLWIVWALGWLPWNLWTHRWVAVAGNLFGCAVNGWLLRRLSRELSRQRALPDWIHLPSPKDVYQHAE